MRNNRPMTLFSAGAVVVAVVGGVAMLTVGRPLLTGEAFRPAPASARLATTATLVTSPASPVASGTQVSLTTTVTPAVAGTVQFKDAATNLGAPVIVSNGAATGTTSTLVAGSHSLVAVFTPTNSAAYGSSTSPAVTFVVNAATATNTILTTAPASPAAQGTPVTLTAMVTPAAAVGTVQFKDGANNLGNPVTVTNGTATGTISTLPMGPHQLTAVFTPTDPSTFGSSTSPAVAYVVSGPVAGTPTSTALATSPPSPVAQGIPVTLTATITPATAAGAVQFRDGTTNLGSPVQVINGNASGTTATLPVGPRSLNAVFMPTNPAAFGPSTSPSVSFIITPGASAGGMATTTGLTTYPASPVRRGTQVVLNATVAPATAAGTVQFRDGATNLGNPVIVSNGAASATTSNLAVGGHQLIAVFTPMDPAAFGASTSPVLAFEVTDRGLADLNACLTVLQNCRGPRVGTAQPSQPDDHASHYSYYAVDGRRNMESFAASTRRRRSADR